MTIYHVYNYREQGERHRRNLTLAKKLMRETILSQKTFLTAFSLRGRRTKGREGQLNSSAKRDRVYVCYAVHTEISLS